MNFPNGQWEYATSTHLIIQFYNLSNGEHDDVTYGNS